MIPPPPTRPLIIKCAGLNFWAADVLITPGARPSKIILLGSTAADRFDTVSDLILQDEDEFLTFRRLRLLSICSRPVRWGDDVSAEYVFEDRRWEWWYKLTTKSYNRLKCNGETVGQKNLKQIFRELFDELNEPTANVFLASERLYPELHYDAPVSYGKILEDLCRMTLHTIGFDREGRFIVYQIGQGPLPPNGTRFKSFRQLTRRSNRSYRVLSKPNIYKSEIRLLPKAMEQNGQLVDLDDVSYKPSPSWKTEWPGLFASVAAASQRLAFQSVYKLFMPVENTAENNQLAAGASLAGKIEVFNSGECAFTDEHSAPVVDYVTGVFWPENHEADFSTSHGDYWHGRIEAKDNIIRSSRPIFRVEDGDVLPPIMRAGLWHRVRAQDGSYQTLRDGGSLTHVRHCEWVQPIFNHDIGNNGAFCLAQLREYRRILEQESQIDSYFGIVAGLAFFATSGNIRHVRYKCGRLATSGTADTEVYVGDAWEGVSL